METVDALLAEERGLSKVLFRPHGFTGVSSKTQLVNTVVNLLEYAGLSFVERKNLVRSHRGAERKLSSTRIMR